MRTNKGILNGIVAIVCNLITIIISFIAQSFFVHILGNEYNGLNGLFSNIISMLSVVELGLGGALIYHLYEPIAKKDKEKIKSLMRFYRNGYRLIAGIILFLAVLTMPFLHFIVSTSLDINIYLVFFLFAVDSATSYLLSYKRSILYADQKNYIINAIRIGYVVVLNLSQIIILLCTRNFYLYLIVKIIARILENVIITMIANKNYSFIKENDVRKLDDDVKKDVFKKIRGLFNHKIGSYIVLGTDNIIISKFLDLTTVGLYTNYNLIVNGVLNLFSQVFYSITASVGNLLVEKSVRKSYVVYRNMGFINFVIACFGSIGFYFVSKPFMVLWLGNDYVLNEITVFVIMIKLYLDLYGYTIGAFKTAGGIFYEDRYVPILQSVVNIAVSVGLVLVMGLPGVIIGTIASTLLLYLYSYPIFVYKRLFNKTYLRYLLELVTHFIIFIAIFVIIRVLGNIIVVDDTILQLAINVMEILTIIPIAIVLLFRRTDEYKYAKRLVKKMIKNSKNMLKRGGQKN